MSSQPSIKDVHARTVVDPKDKKAFVLKDRPTRGDQLFESKKDAKSSLDADALVINELQDAMFASKCGSLLVVMQGIDTAGKDGTTKECFKYTSPLGVHVHAFGKPTEIELAHDYLWRIHAVAPRKGHITVFNRSQYEDVLVVKVRNLAPPKQVEKRYEQINQFEKSLTENGTHILKLMLHVSKEEQGERLRERLEVPAKRWKFNPSDLEDRKLWDEYQHAYEAVLQRCSTPWAPWHVIPSDSRSRRDAIAARLIRGALEEMKPEYPDPGYRLEQYQID
ncbi:MAG TPA: polyphosphate kinase 2 family protein [Hyphomonadaceae bacterium]|nr:polyphosphate kinase 2 family protein [Hyphomonadaceae bacterium]HPI50032.1 polyphosphate kinase 2 family protein [Hyphomonadaceae bacterium]